MDTPTNPFTSGEPLAAFVNFFLDAFIKPVVDNAKDAVSNKISQHKEQQRWIDAAEAYRAHVIEHVGKFRILGKYQDVDLGNIYSVPKGGVKMGQGEA